MIANAEALIPVFWSQVDMNGPLPAVLTELENCWIWKGSYAANPKYGSPKYGVVWFNKRHSRAHRVSYELVRGDIPAGLVIDHLCRNSMCVRPSHLEAVTVGTNTLRGISPVANNAKKQYCPKGHPYDIFRPYRDGKAVGIHRECSRCANAARKETKP